jgi:hypothetical protein
VSANARISGAVDWFIATGARLFGGDNWHRAPFQGILYLFLWAAAIKISVTGDQPIPFSETLDPFSMGVWTVLSLACPPMAFMAWWLIIRSRLPRAALIGLWVRLAADVGQFAALLAYHLVTLNADLVTGEALIYLHYLTAAVLAFCLILVMRDLWSIVATERLAR